MGDILRLNKDKRHRSSSSITSPSLEGTCSERKLDIKGKQDDSQNLTSIPEADDQFALAEARCQELQDKIDYVKGLKRKKKLKKRSVTRFTDIATPEALPTISVRTQLKKPMGLNTPLSGVSITAGTLPLPKRVAPKPMRRFVDQDTVEQHRMLGQVRGYGQSYKSHYQKPNLDIAPHCHHDTSTTLRKQSRHALADGDRPEVVEIACGDNLSYEVQRPIPPNRYRNENKNLGKRNSAGYKDERHSKAQMLNNDRRRDVSKDHDSNDTIRNATIHNAKSTSIMNNNPQLPRRLSSGTTAKNVLWQQNLVMHAEERPVVELFNKHRPATAAQLGSKDQLNRDGNGDDESKTIRLDDENTLQDQHRYPRRVKFRSRRYELPTVASQMKQAGVRYYSSSNTNCAVIPFIISKSTAPSHNIAVNIQQVLNGFKNQQPLSKIPLTIAYHMGIGHVPAYGKRDVQPTLDNLQMNAVRVGRRLLRLPDKYVSYNRLLSLYRESDGLVSRFLRAIGRPPRFYASMYNLATMSREESAVPLSIKNRHITQEAKQSLAAYASLYREYKQVEQSLKKNYSVKLENHKEDLIRELAAREECIRKVMHEHEQEPMSVLDSTYLRASASNAEDSYRFTSKFNMGDMPQ